MPLFPYTTQLQLPQIIALCLVKGANLLAFLDRLERSFKRVTMTVMNNDMDRRAEVNTERAYNGRGMPGVLIEHVIYLDTPANYTAGAINLKIILQLFVQL